MHITAGMSDRHYWLLGYIGIDQYTNSWQIWMRAYYYYEFVPWILAN